ncbi:MAG: lipoprotein-releasing system ATP-binding protein [Alphaproteobacteria bacterium]|jgi:lipoprotein-releasing system ATP-binding protein
MSNNIVLSLDNISHFYGKGNNQLTVLDKLNFTLESGKICALLGPSGSGKSTILQIAGLLDTPKEGKIIINQTVCNHLNDDEKSKFRGQEIGFIYQFHRLLPELTAIENVMMPQLFFNKTPKEARERAFDLLQKLGLEHRVTHLPTELSGGEQQRVAIARALANKPKLILADEPTGNLDPKTSEEVFGQLTEFVQSQGAAALIATHNMALADKADFIFQPFK